MTGKQWVGAATLLLTGIVIGVSGGTPAAQPAARTPYQPPRTPHGQPDLQGIWQVANTAAWDIQDHHARLAVPGGQGVVEGNHIPYQPWAVRQKEQNFERRAELDSVARCFKPGTPRITYLPYPFQIVQRQNEVTILYEYNQLIRHIYVDGSPHWDDVPFWMGDSRGHWEGDTLVVDVRNFTEETWFDAVGNFHSEALRLTERYTRISPDHLRYEVTVDDPKVFTRPWTMSMPIYRRLEEHVRLVEYPCYALSMLETDRFDRVVTSEDPRDR